MTLPVSNDPEGTDVVEAPEVGEYYWVSFVKTASHLARGVSSRHHYYGWQPIIGPLHEDREIIGFPEEHWHVDWRFARKKYYDSLSRWTQGYVLNKSHCIEAGKVFRRRVKCHRLMDVHGAPTGAIRWIKGLEDAYEGKKMKCLTCPHRAMPMDPRHIDAQGRIVCTGHGLQWDVGSGDLVRRTIKTGEEGLS